MFSGRCRWVNIKIFNGEYSHFISGFLSFRQIDGKDQHFVFVLFSIHKQYKKRDDKNNQWNN